MTAPNSFHPQLLTLPEELLLEIFKALYPRNFYTNKAWIHDAENAGDWNEVIAGDRAARSLKNSCKRLRQTSFTMLRKNAWMEIERRIAEDDLTLWTKMTIDHGVREPRVMRMTEELNERICERAFGRGSAFDPSLLYIWQSGNTTLTPVSTLLRHRGGLAPGGSPLQYRGASRSIGRQGMHAGQTRRRSASSYPPGLRVIDGRSAIEMWRAVLGEFGEWTKGRRGVS